jgi:hypothetical protein
VATADVLADPTRFGPETGVFQPDLRLVYRSRFGGVEGRLLSSTVTPNMRYLVTIGDSSPDPAVILNHLVAEARNRERMIIDVVLPPKRVTVMESTNGGEVLMFGPNFSVNRVQPFIFHFIQDTPKVSNTTLDHQAANMRPSMQKFLASLGRDPTERGVHITLTRKLNPDETYQFHNTLTFAGAELQLLMNKARFHCLECADDDPKSLFRNDKLVGSKAGSSTDWPKDEYDRSQLMAIAGPVHILWDINNANEVVAVPRVPDGILPVCVSVAGINFAYSDQDRTEYLNAQGHIDTRKAFHRMRQICYLIFETMAYHGVQVPVLSAIGCGAFRGTAPNSHMVPRLWAAAMVSVLQNTFHPFYFVVLSLPTFGDHDNMTAFTTEFQRGANRLSVPVVLTSNHGIVSLAVARGQRLNLCAGNLNPSDVVALRTGTLGMYWDGTAGPARRGPVTPRGHVALEEVLFTQLLLCVHHIGLNPELYKDPHRLHKMEMPVFLDKCSLGGDPPASDDRLSNQQENNPSTRRGVGNNQRGVRGSRWQELDEERSDTTHPIRDSREVVSDADSSPSKSRWHESRWQGSRWHDNLEDTD